MPLKVSHIRKIHQYFGLVIGIQFLLWTIGGIYFSWTNIDTIHGDKHKRPFSHYLSPSDILISPTAAFEHIGQQMPLKAIKYCELINVLQNPYYSIESISQNGSNQKWLVDAKTGKVSTGITAIQAITIAKSIFEPNVPIKKIVLITQVNGHHEYRNQPLPAYAVSFDHPSGTVVYVSVHNGKVQRFRNNQWRIYDALWMLHTMDFYTRDDINNWLLRIISIAGLITIISGFILFIWVWSKKVKR